MKLNRISIGWRYRESCFTLVETIAVIAIVGTLAATALPKMTAWQAKRVMRRSTMRGRHCPRWRLCRMQVPINGQTAQSFQDSTVALVHGYPAATEATAEAAGLEENYGVYTRAAGASATTPPVHAGSMSLVPKGTAGTARATDCFLVYEQASATRPVAKISLGGNANAKTCA